MFGKLGSYGYPGTVGFADLFGKLILDIPVLLGWPIFEK